MPELELQTLAPTEDEIIAKREERDRHVMHACLAVIGIFLFLLPVFAAVADYWTDIYIGFYMHDTLQEYNSNANKVRNNINNPSDSNLVLVCYPNNTNASLSVLYDFAQFTLSNSTSLPDCICSTSSFNSFTEFENSSCPLGDDSNLMTSNLGSECENEANYGVSPGSAGSGVECVSCECGVLSPRAESSPQFLYGLQLYSEAQDSNDEDYIRSHCRPNSLYSRVTKSSKREELEVNLSDVRNANAAFLVLSGLFLLGYMALAAMILFREFCSLMCHSCWHRERDPLNYDELTWLVLILVLLHLFQDLPQLIIGGAFSVYYLQDDGAECVENWRNQDFLTDVGPTRRTEVSNFFEGVLWNDIVAWFFMTSFFHVFIHGVYAVSLVEFRFSRMLDNPWHKNVLFLIASLVLGCLALWLFLVPFWYSIWESAEFFGFDDGLNDALLVVVLAGGVAWVAICFMMIFGCMCCSEGEACCG